MTIPIHLNSIGFAAQQLQLPIATILATAGQLGITTSSINGVIHFSEADVGLIRAAVADIRRQQEVAMDQRSRVM